MADYIEGQDLVKQDAYDAVLKLDKMMGDLVAKFDLVAKSAISMNDTIVKSTSIPEVQQNQNTQKKNLDEIIKLEEKLKQAISDKGKVIELLRMELAKQNAANKELVKDLQAQETSYNKLDLTLKKLKASYKAMTEAETQSTKGQALLSHIQQLDTKIKALDATMGVHNRNVGNYKNATFQLTQVMRELPNFAQSAEIGIRSLSNNLPMLADSFGQVRKEAGGTLPALKIFASSLFTFAGIFPLVLGGLIAYSDEIIKFGKNIFSTNTEYGKMTELQQKSIESSQAEITKMQQLYAISTNVGLSITARKEATDELQRLYPAYFANLKDEVIMAGNAVEAYNNLTSALMNKAMYEAISEQATESAKALIPLTLELSRVEDQIAFFEKEKAGKSINGYAVVGSLDPNAESTLELLRTQAADLREQIKPLKAELNQLFGVAGKFLGGAKGLNVLGGGGTKTTGTTKAPKAPKAEKIKAPELDEDVLTKMKTNLAQLQLESKESIRAGIQDNFKDSAKVMAEQIDKLQAEINKNQLSVTIEWTNQDKLEAWVEEAIPVLEAISGIAQSMQQATQSVTGALSDKVNREAELQIEAIDAKTEAELDAIDRLTLSESEREERKKIVELQAEARRKKIEEDKIKQLRKFAAVQKYADILAITAATALAVMNTYADKKLIALGLNIPAAIAVGIAGAAQIAAVAAAPLPQYELGTPEGGHTGGKAIVGEAGTELGRTPDGKLFLTPSKASIMDLPKRTEIIPHDITKDLLGATMVRLAQANTAVSLDMYQDELIEAFERGTDKITKAIYKNRTNISIGGSYRDYVKSNQL